MHELTIGANDATKTSEDKSNIQAEFSQLQSEIARIADSAAKFNGKALFDTTFSSGVSTQVGADSGQTVNLKLVDLKSDSTTDIDGSGGSKTWDDIIDGNKLSVTSSSSIADLKTAIDFISTKRASIGGQQSRFETTRAGLLSYEDNIRAAESKIRDVDMARESSNMVKNQILSQVGNAMLAQSNQLPQSVLQLVG
jgi:flagellin